MDIPIQSPSLLLKTVIRLDGFDGSLATAFILHQVQENCRQRYNKGSQATARGNVKNAARFSLMVSSACKEPRKIGEDVREADPVNGQT